MRLEGLKRAWRLSAANAAPSDMYPLGAKDVAATFHLIRGERLEGFQTIGPATVA